MSASPSEPNTKVFGSGELVSKFLRIVGDAPTGRVGGIKAYAHAVRLIIEKGFEYLTHKR